MNESALVVTFLAAFLAVAVLLGLIPAGIASQKGRSFLGWWIFGTSFFLVALVCALVITPTDEALDERRALSGQRRCPHCAEFIRAEARVCPFCGRDIPAPAGITAESHSELKRARRLHRPWWEIALRLLPAVVFLATFGIFFLQKNEQARAVFRSGRGILTLAVIIGGYVALGVLLRRFVRWSWVAPVVLAGVVLGLAAWIVRPYYVDTRDDTRLVAGEVADASEAAESSDEAAEDPADPAAGMAVRVATGELQGLTGHRAAGTVSLVEDVDGSYVVRFENFDIEGTPDPIIYLIEGADQRNPGGASLGAQRGNVGEVSDYAVPAGVEPGAGWTVLVWCGQFAVEIANATLAAA